MIPKRRVIILTVYAIYACMFVNSTVAPKLNWKNIFSISIIFFFRPFKASFVHSCVVDCLGFAVVAYAIAVLGGWMPWSDEIIVRVFTYNIYMFLQKS